MIKKLNDVRDIIEDICKKPDQRGELTGFSNLDKIYSVKQGSFTCFLGAPGHGKSELIFELCINQTLEFGKRHMIYSPETGSVAEIMLEIGHKYCGRPLYQTSYYGDYCNEKERSNVLEWVNYNFIFQDGDEEAISFDELCEQLLKEEQDSKNPIHTLMAEPYNEIRHDKMSLFGSRQDLYIESFMSDVRRFTKKHNKHVFLSFHPGHQEKIVKGKFSYYPMPSARQAAGGQAALRKAMTWINLWRPPTSLKNEWGENYKDNEVVLIVEKAKPKGVSFRGTCSLFFDWKKNRYFENLNALNIYAFEHKKQFKFLGNQTIESINTAEFDFEISQVDEKEEADKAF
jgi:hypothetical protein